MRKEMKSLLVAMLLVCTNAIALDGLVLDAHDGDSITVQGISQRIRVRRADTPEFAAFGWGNQPYREEARAATVKLCVGNVATLSRMSYDNRTKRMLADVKCQGQDLATHLISNGDAWAYRYNSTKATRAMQADAKKRGVGLWALPNPIEPYLWRKNKMQP